MDDETGLTTEFPIGPQGGPAAIGCLEADPYIRAVVVGMVRTAVPRFPRLFQ